MKGLLSVFLFIYAAKDDGSKKRVGRTNSFFCSLMLALLLRVQLDRHIGIAFNE